MNISSKSIIRKIENNKWWLEECPMSFFLFDYIAKAFVSAGRITGYPTLKETIYLLNDNIGMEITPYEEKKKIKVFKK